MPLTPTHAPGTPCWVDLQTTDPAGARAFYARLFGWEYDLLGPELGHYAIARLGPHPVGGIGGLPPGAAHPPAWMPHLATADADAAAARVTELGGVVAVPCMDVGAMGRMFVAVDPTGAAFGVWEARAMHGAGVLREPGALVWAEVNTRAPEAARDFYTALGGLQATATEGAPTTYFTLSRDGGPVAGVLGMDEAWAGIPPHWMSYFQTADIDAACATVRAAGGAVPYGPFPTPFGRVAVCRDPQGAHFSLLQPPA